ncbi:MAG: hypothetical protein CM1200mP32_04260 [Methanobacteriota archaeon]|nr:MAG: hypothetical protein CM1200mP32_04260 [Euryarchaeota archaeon]
MPRSRGLSDNWRQRDSNGCDVDQIVATGDDPETALRTRNGNPVLAVKDEWVVGVALSPEIPWLGAAKLAFSGTAHQVTDTTWRSLAMVIAGHHISALS